MELHQKEGFYFVSLTDAEFIILARPGSLLCRLRANAPARCDWQWQLGPGDEKFLALRQDHLDVIANTPEIATMLVEMDLQGLLYEHLLGLDGSTQAELTTAPVEFPFYQGHLSPDSEEYAVALEKWKNSKKCNPLDHPVNSLPSYTSMEVTDLSTTLPENLETTEGEADPFSITVDLASVELGADADTTET